MPFETPALLTDHFDKHKDEFGVTTEEEYAALAEAFCYGAINPSVEVHVRTTDGATLRYNNATNELGIIGRDNFIKTYFKPSAGRRYFLKKCV